MNELRITLVFRKIIPYVSASTLVHSGTPISRCCIPTTRKNPANPGRPVCARASSLKKIFEFVTLKEATAGSAAASNRSGRAMEPCCSGSANVDIEELKRAEDALRESEYKLRQI